MESFDTCIGELQQQTYAQRLELEDAHFGYAESRREQFRPQEELVMKEKALRDAQIGSIHEMGELKRAQELRVDEFSVQKLSESHDTIQKLTSQIQELQERVSALNKILENSHVKKVSLEEQKAQKEDRFLRGRQIACMIYDCFRVTGAHDTVLDNAD